MVPLSILDLSPITEESDAGQALRNSRDLARHVEALGYRRYWMAEHHNLPGVASAATAVALAHVAPGAGLEVPIWILGSSTYGAQLAAMLGLPFSFASHFAPAMLMQAIDIYRQRFRPSEQLSVPHLMLGVTVVAAETDEEARFL